ncbi:hypothetical protein [Pseudodesulfovibrio sp. S3-i]|nr:hypothetical protein [Pseudodesulfovibrio sp. S3-i]
MADSFFGTRKEMDNALEAFSGMVKEFLPTVELLFQAASTLRLLLIDDHAVSDFCESLGLKPSDILPAEGAPPHIYTSVPFSLTARGRYIRCVFKAYGALQAIVNEYVHGRHYNDPESPGRKRLTMHYTRLEEIARLINHKIRKVNETVSTTAILRQVKGMNPDQFEREQIMGDLSLVDGSTLDKDMCFMPIDFEGYGLPQVRELPPVKEVEDVIRRFCKKLYANRKAEANRAMTVLRGQ